MSRINTSASDDGSSILRGFLNDLFLEKAASVHNSKDKYVEDDKEKNNSSWSSTDSDSVTLSSDEETSLASLQSSTSTINTNSSSSSIAQPSGQYHRLRQVTVASDNARAILNGPLKGASAHSYSTSAHSLGSRNSISYNSISNWRNSKQANRLLSSRKASTATTSKRNQDYRWSNNMNYSRGQHYEFGQAQDSLHNQRRKSREKIKKPSRGSNKDQPKTPTTTSREKGQEICAKSTIDSAVALLSSITDEAKIVGDADSMSSVLSFGTNTSSITNNFQLSSIGIDKNRFQRSRSSLKRSNVLTPSSFTSFNAMPEIPQRSRDDNSVTVASGSKHSVQRSHSDDLSLLTASLHQSIIGNDVGISIESRLSTESRKSKRRSSDPVGRWAAIITTKGWCNDDDSSSDNEGNKAGNAPPAPPRRKLSGGDVGYGSFFSNDSDLEDDSDGDDSLFGSEMGSFMNSTTTYDCESLLTKDIENSRTFKSPNDAFGFPKSEPLGSTKSLSPGGLSPNSSRPSTYPLTIPDSLRRLPNFDMDQSHSIHSFVSDGYSSL